MMANWDKLNKQFDDLLDSMTIEDWQFWANNREQKKMRVSEMLLKAKLQEEKLLLSNTTGKSIFFQGEILSEKNSTTALLTGLEFPKNNQHAMAA